MKPINPLNPQCQARLGRYKRCSLVLVVLLFQLGCVQQGVYHRVKPGQTLYRISKTYKINETYLARINGISDPSQLRVGTRIYVPGARSVKYVPATVPKKSTKFTSKPAAKVKVAKAVPKTRPASQTRTLKKTSPKKHPKSSTRLTTRSRKSHGKLAIKLRWPLRGKILRAFGTRGKSGGKGLEIAAREGSRVSAAAAGKVIYSGNGVQGYGHLMILQHENDVFTVYGFNSRNFVKQGQFVSQGERIARSGRPPSGESGRLHFEVRVGKQAIDPILYLP